jgi:hypothetical protein
MMTLKQPIAARARREEPQGVYVKEEWVDAGVAHGYIKRSFGDNRARSRAWVQYLMEQMSAGKWCDTGNPAIHFNQRGQLVNGHHTLEALTKTKARLNLRVAYNLTDEAVRVLDTGRPRTLSQILRMFSKTKNATQVVGVTRACVLIYEGLAHDDSTTLLRVPEDLTPWQEKFQEGLDFVFTLGKGATCDVLAALAVAHKTSPQKVEEFATRLVKGLGEHETEPAVRLRATLDTHRKAGGDAVRAQRILYTLTACRAALQERRIAKLYAAKDALEFFLKAHKGAA